MLSALKDDGGWGNREKVVRLWEKNPLPYRLNQTCISIVHGFSVQHSTNQAILLNSVSLFSFCLVKTKFSVFQVTKQQ